MIKHFDYPTQVKFWDYESDGYLGGIGYGEYIIRLDCGGLIELADFEDTEFPEGIEPIVPLTWVSLSDACIAE